MGPTYNYYWDINDPALPFLRKDICNAMAIVPDNATRIEIPAYKTGTIPCWNSDAWVVRADWRQEILYDITTGKQTRYPTVDVDEDYFKAHFTTIPPTSEYDKWDGEKWVLDKEAETNAKISTLIVEWRKALNVANIQIAMLTDGINYLVNTNGDTTELDERLAEWKIYRGELVALNITTGDEVLPEQPTCVEDKHG